MITLVTISTALIKAVVDLYRWPFINHWVGFVISAAIILAVCLMSSEIYPIFLFNVLFNPALNTLKGLSFFYIGDTADTDKLLKQLFGKIAGEVWFFCNLTLLILTI